MNEKRKRMALNSADMPNEVYKILNEKALKRSLTSYVIELVEERFKSQELFGKLDKIENKIDDILSKNFKIDKELNEKNNDELVEENPFREGTIIEASKILGGIDDADKIEGEF